MEQVNENFGKLNVKAPSALSHFAFLIGRWTFEAKLMSSDGSWHVFHGTWNGHFILDGFAIADEYAMSDSDGEVLVLGMNVRTYDGSKRTWNIRWLDALSGAWTDLAPEEFGGLKITERSIRYYFREPMAAQAYTRGTYTNISSQHFTWLGDKSDDGQSWTDFMVVECHRAEATTSHRIL